MSRNRAKILVSGRVQGVGYRYFATTQARRFDITGYAKNLPDGKVEVLAEGTPKALGEFISALERGPASGRVSECQINWQAGRREYTDFTIRY